MNLAELLQQLQASAGPRGATFAGRMVQPGQTLEETLRHYPLNVPEESFGMMPALKPNARMLTTSEMNMGFLDDMMKNAMFGETQLIKELEKRKKGY